MIASLSPAVNSKPLRVLHPDEYQPTEADLADLAEYVGEQPGDEPWWLSLESEWEATEMSARADEYEDEQLPRVPGWAIDYFPTVLDAESPADVFRQSWAA